MVKPLAIEPSASMNFNAVGPVTDLVWQPYNRPVPGLRSYYNRGFWLSKGRLARGQVEPNLELADAFVNNNLAQGIKPWALMVDDPDTPFDAEAFGDHCASMATRYLGRVNDFEICNEGDSEGSWCFDGLPGGTTMGLAWRAGFDAIKSVNPRARVVCGSIQSIWPGGHGLQTLRNALVAFGPDLPPDIAIHVYPTRGQWPIVAKCIERVRGACNSYAKGDPNLWITEFGPWPSNFSSWSEVDQSLFLRYMFGAFREAKAAGAFFFIFDDANGLGFKDLAKGTRTWNAAVSALYGYR